jgi:hypothetical protein
MIAKSALAPVSEAVAAILNVAPLLAICPEGIWDDVRPNSPFPVGWYSLLEVPWRAFQQPGLMLELGLHIYTPYAGHQEGQRILGMAIDLLHAVPTPAPIDGFLLHWFDYMGTVPMPDVVINGVNTKHLHGRASLVVTQVED